MNDKHSLMLGWSACCCWVFSATAPSLLPHDALHDPYKRGSCFTAIFCLHICLYSTLAICVKVADYIAHFSTLSIATSFRFSHIRHYDEIPAAEVGYENSPFSKINWLYIENDTKYLHSYVEH